MGAVLSGIAKGVSSLANTYAQKKSIDEAEKADKAAKLKKAAAAPGAMKPVKMSVTPKSSVDQGLKAFRKQTYGTDESENA